jgi:hypothetical protein
LQRAVPLQKPRGYSAAYGETIFWHKQQRDIFDMLAQGLVMLFTAGANNGRLFIVMDKAMHEPQKDFVNLKYSKRRKTFSS